MLYNAAPVDALLFGWRTFSSLLFCRSNSFLSQPGLMCRFGNF